MEQHESGGKGLIAATRNHWSAHMTGISRTFKFGLLLVALWSLGPTACNTPNNNAQNPTNSFDIASPAVPTLSQQDDNFAAFIENHQLKCAASATGLTNGFVANATLTNLTDQPLDVQGGPFLIVSPSRNEQDYVDTVIFRQHVNPGATATVPLTAWCITRTRPPPGNGVPIAIETADGKLLATPGAEGSVIQGAIATSPENAPASASVSQPPYSSQDAQRIVAIATLTRRSAETVAKRSDLPQEPYSGQALVTIGTQHALWTNPELATITNSKAESKDDFKAMMLQKAKTANGAQELTQKQNEQVNKGADDLFQYIDLTQKEVTVLDASSAH
jgi:hypothetical protein